MEDKKLNIYEKMLAITSELTRVAKNLQVGEGKFAYKAVGEADILAAVRPLEEKYKVYSYPAKRQIVETGEMETKSGSKNIYMRIETTYKFVNTENKDEYVEIVSYGDGVDSQDKAPGKAMTYADKYALMKAYKIMTGDDPDQHASEELKSRNKSQNKPNSASSKSSQTNTPNYREKLISLAKTNGWDMNQIAQDYKLNAKSTQEDFKKAWNDLRPRPNETYDEAFVQEVIVHDGLDVDIY